VLADDGRSQADDDEVDIERYINVDSAHVSVKILRKVIPKLRIACYFSDEQMSGKRKCEQCQIHISRLYVFHSVYFDKHLNTCSATCSCFGVISS